MDCDEPLHPSRLPENSTKENTTIAIIESLGLLPTYNWDILQPTITRGSIYEEIWMVQHQKRVARWRDAAGEWSKSYHRALICHKQRCRPSIVITEHDVSVETLSDKAITELFR